jgi:hypothetical protein
MDPLTQARQLYNERRYDAAITVAERARAIPATANAARLVLARARLERFRRSEDPHDLTLAHEALREIRPEVLTPRDQIEFLVGLGEALYLDSSFGPAAELFDSVLRQPGVQDSSLRERVLDWWATAVDRDAQARPPEERAFCYATMLERIPDELSADPQSAAAAYWLSAAARGAGDVDRAWNTAIAGWVRAGLTRDRGTALRADLDRLVTEAIIPERARAQATNDATRARLATDMLAQWTALKQRWVGQGSR